jgi:cell division protein FtsI (penicillin-binding protein 3)
LNYRQTLLWWKRFDNYKNNPKKFVNHINSYGFNKKNMDFKGEGKGIYSSAER